MLKQALKEARNEARRAKKDAEGMPKETAATMRELLEVNKKQLACLLEMKDKGGAYQLAA